MNEVEEVGLRRGRGRGRPKKENPVDVKFSAWISQEEKDMVDHMLIESDKSKSELLRRMIRLYYNVNHGRW